MKEASIVTRRGEKGKEEKKKKKSCVVRDGEVVRRRGRRWVEELPDRRWVWSKDG